MFVYERGYRGPVQAVVFDLAGTIIDFGSLAPAGVFVEVFASRQVAITAAEARGPMGAEKRTHIAMLLAVPAIRARFEQAHGRAPTDADIDAMYAQFIPLQVEALPRYSGLIPGVLDAVAELRRHGPKIGVNTGYNREMMEVCLREAGAQGLAVDSAVAASDVPRARPKPAMCLRNLAELAVDDVRASVKVDDTIPGIDEGLSAGMWTVGVAVSGNEVGLSLADWGRLGPDEQATLRETARRRLFAAGAHYVVDTAAEIGAVVADIDARLARGERP